MFKKINYAGFPLPTLTQTKSAVTLGCWFATVMITNALITNAFGWFMTKLQQMILARKLAKLQNQLAPTVEEAANEPA